MSSNEAPVSQELWDDFPTSSMPLKDDQMKTKESTFLLIPVMALAIPTVLLNILVMYLSSNLKKVPNTSKLYVTSLALSDTLVAVVSVILYNMQNFLSHFPDGFYMCLLYSWIDTSFRHCSLLHMCLIGYDRYKALTNAKVRGNKYRQDVSRRCCYAWLLSFLSTLLTRIALYSTNSKVKKCMFLNNKPLIIVESVILYLSPVIFVVGIYCLIICGIRKRLLKKMTKQQTGNNTHQNILIISGGNGLNLSNICTIKKDSHDQGMGTCVSNTDLELKQKYLSNEKCIASYNNDAFLYYSNEGVLKECPGTSNNSEGQQRWRYNTDSFLSASKNIDLLESDMSSNLHNLPVINDCVNINSKSCDITDVRNLVSLSSAQLNYQTNSTSPKSSIGKTDTAKPGREHGRFSVDGQKSPPKVEWQKQDIHAIKVSLSVVTSCVICWLPFCFFLPIATIYRTGILKKLLQCSYWLACVSSLLNPVLTLTMNRDFNRALYKLIRR